MLDLVRVVCSKILRDCATAGCGEYLRGVLTGSTFLRGVLRGVLTGSGSTYGEYYGEYLRGVCMVRTAAHVRYYFNAALSQYRAAPAAQQHRGSTRKRERRRPSARRQSPGFSWTLQRSRTPSHTAFSGQPLYTLYFILLRSAPMAQPEVLLIADARKKAARMLAKVLVERRGAPSPPRLPLVERRVWHRGAVDPRRNHSQTCTLKYLKYKVSVDPRRNHSQTCTLKYKV